MLAALGEHLSNAQIASRLHLSVRTVETHVSSLLRKLDAADRRELATLAPSVTAAGPDAGAVRGRPATWTPFIGRTRERAAVLGALHESRLVTLLGPGGVGKTRLAAAVAEELALELPLGAAFVQLVSVRPGFLVQAVASVFGVTERPGQPLREAVLDRLQHGRSLLVLDNCEHLLDDTAEFLTALFGGSAELAVLTTSRERIGVDGERLVPLPGLSLAGDPSGDPAGSEAVTLFFDRARAVDPHFDADPAAVAQLCAEVDGMPLAIELACARTAALGVTGLRAGLDDRLRLLTGGRSADHRHRSLRAVLDWSHDLLDDDERVAFRRLGLFAGDFDLAAAGAVAGLPVGPLADLVGRLSDKSLIVHRGTQDGRWGLLETVRAYAVEKMTAAGELDAVRSAHLQWVVARASALEGLLETDGGWREAFDLVVDDLRAALLSASDPAMAHALARSLGHLAYARRFLAEARQHYRTAADHAPDNGAAGHDLSLAADVAQVEMRGDLRFELELEAAERAAAEGDGATQATALAEAVSAAMRWPATFESDVPLSRLQELLALAEAVTPDAAPSVRAQLAAARAWIETHTVDVPQPAGFETALAAARRVDDPVLISAMLDGLGSVILMGGRFRKAYEMSQERFGLRDRLPGHYPHAGPEIHDLLHMTVETAVTAGELAVALDASRLLEDDRLVAAIEHMVASKPVVPLALTGRFDEAIARCRRARVVWERAGSPPARWLAPPVYAAAMCFGLRGQTGEFDEWRAVARDRLAGAQTRIVHFQLGGMATFADARVALHHGDLDEAVRAIDGLPAEPDAWWSVRHWYFDAYPWAIAAEVAVVAGLPDADRRVAAAQPAGEQNPWAAACLARVRGRMSGDPAELAGSVAGWERLGARFERACTLLLIDDRADEGRAELAALGCRPAIR